MDACTFGHVARKAATNGFSDTSELKSAMLTGLTTIGIVAALVATWASDRTNEDLTAYDTDYPLDKIDKLCGDDDDGDDYGDGDDAANPCNKKGIHSAIALMGFQFFAQCSLAAGMASVLLTVL
jgi:hypothetical protein